MKFEHSNIFLLLWFALPLAGLLILAMLRREKILQQFLQGSPNLWRTLCASVHWRRRRIKVLFLVLAFVFSVLALARPQWGFELREVKRQGTDILLAIDVSKSMLTQDVAPNRLERTKLAVRDLIGQLRGDRVGLIAFAGDAFLACPLTSDYGGVLLSLENLNVQSIPRGGTNVSSAIKEAIRVYHERKIKNKTMIILTDGDNLEGEPLALAEKAKADGIKIYTVGIGTREGELVRVPDKDGGSSFLKDKDGNFVKSRLNEQLLQDIALATGGLYVRASGAQFGLDIIYEREIAKFEKTEYDAQMKRRYFERFQWPLSIAVVLLVLATALPERQRQ